MVSVQFNETVYVKFFADLNQTPMYLVSTTYRIVIEDHSN